MNRVTSTAVSGMHWDAGWRTSADAPGTLLRGAGADRQLAIDGLHPDTIDADVLAALGLAQTDVRYGGALAIGR